MLRLRELRLEREKTQSELANILGISRQVYANYENEINEPSLDILKKLSLFFECSIDYLIGHTDDFGNVTVENSELSENEQKLLEDYRSLPRQEKVQAEEYVHYLAERRGVNKKNA